MCCDQAPGPRASQKLRPFGGRTNPASDSRGVTRMPSHRPSWAEPKRGQLSRGFLCLRRAHPWLSRRAGMRPAGRGREARRIAAPSCEGFVALGQSHSARRLVTAARQTISPQPSCAGPPCLAVTSPGLSRLAGKARRRAGISSVWLAFLRLRAAGTGRLAPPLAHVQKSD